MDIIYQPVSVSLNWNSENYNIVSQIRTKPYEPYRTDRIIQYPVSSSIELLDDKSFYEYNTYVCIRTDVFVRTYVSVRIEELE